MINACLITSKSSHLFRRRGFLQSFQTESPFRIDEGMVPVEILHCQYVLLQRFHCWHAVFEDFLPSVTPSFHFFKKRRKKKKKKEDKIISLGFPSKQLHVTVLNAEEEQCTPNLWVYYSVIIISEEKCCPFQQDMFFLLGIVFDVRCINCQIVFSD